MLSRKRDRLHMLSECAHARMLKIMVMLDAMRMGRGHHKFMNE